VKTPRASHPTPQVAAAPAAAALAPSSPDAGPPVEGAALLPGVIDAQSELAAVDLEPETLIRVAAGRASEITGADGVAVAMLDGDAFAYRHAGGALSAYAGRHFTCDAGVLGYAARTGETHHSRDVTTDPSGGAELWPHAAVRSLIAVPLRHGGESIGLLMVVSTSPHAFRAAHVQALRVLGGILASALSHSVTLGANKALLAERTAALAALRESEERFRNAFEHASIGMAIVALDGRWTRVNIALCEIVGYSEAELLTTDFQHITHPDDLEADFASMRQLVSGAVRYYHLTKRYYHKHGHVVWAALSVSLVRDERGRPLYFIAQIQDVSQQKQSEWLEDDRRDVLEMVACHQPLDSILDRLCRMAERQVPGVCASVVLLQDGSLRNVGPNLPVDFNDALRPKMLSLAAALCARAELNGRFAACDIANDPEWAIFRDAAAAHGLRGCWAAPVRSSEGDFLGMVTLYLRRPRKPDEWGQRLLDLAVRLATVAIEHRDLAQQLTHRAFHDPLTGLPNRVLFEERLEHAIARARRNRTSVALLAVDLDRFKSINDSLGHEAGDELLQQFAQRIHTSLRETDTVARVGGDEFMVVLPDLNEAAGAEVVARKLVDAMQAAFHVAGRDLRVTASIGVCVYPRDAQDLLTLQRGSDAALYRAKGSWGRFALANEPETESPDAPPGVAPKPPGSGAPALHIR
jgi:diguanylate cyclase (GGDEF)-like protein/PAS domain S-box-containing protein